MEDTVADDESDSVAEELAGLREALSATGTVLDADGQDARVDALLARDCRPALVSATEEPSVGCTLPEAFGYVRPGQAVHLDDGKITGVVVSADRERIRLRITSAGRDSTRLRADKGINLPESADPTALTEADREHLPFVVRYADLVQMSFARGPGDVEASSGWPSFRNRSCGCVRPRISWSSGPAPHGRPPVQEERAHATTARVAHTP